MHRTKTGRRPGVHTGGVRTGGRACRTHELGSAVCTGLAQEPWRCCRACAGAGAGTRAVPGARSALAGAGCWVAGARRCWTGAEAAGGTGRLHARCQAVQLLHLLHVAEGFEVFWSWEAHTNTLWRPTRVPCSALRTTQTWPQHMHVPGLMATLRMYRHMALLLCSLCVWCRSRAMPAHKPG